MIDERINQTLSELERNLRDVESSRQEVERTISSFNGLAHTSQEYVAHLNNLTTEVNRLVNSIDTDYSHRVEELEKDREAIIQSSRDASKELSNATNHFKHSLSKITSLLIFNLVLTSVSLIAIIGIIISRIITL